MKKACQRMVVSLFVVIFCATSLVFPVRAVVERQSDTTWYPASGGWEYSISNSLYFDSAYLVPLPMPAFDADAIRTYYFKVINMIDKNDPTLVKLSKTSANGKLLLYTDQQNVTPGTYTFCIVNKTNGNRTIDLRWEVEVKSGQMPAPVPVGSITLNSNQVLLELSGGNTYKLMATILPITAKNKTVLWTSSNEAVAKVDANGKITGVAVGRAVITATTVDGNKRATCQVVVVDSIVDVTGVSLSPTAATLNVGRKTKLTPILKPSNASNPFVSWSSADPSVAKVDEEGNVTGLKAGSTVITVKTSCGDFTATATIKVTNITIPVTNVQLNRSAASLGQGKTLVLRATITPANATNKGIKWTSSNSKVATVDQTGRVTAKAGGTATITATTLSGALKSSCKITVSYAPVATSKVALTSTRSKYMTVKWDKVPNSSGYILYRSTSAAKGFVQVGKTSKIAFTDKNLKSRKTYYYKIRAYKTVAGKTYLGAYSKVFKGKVK